MHIILVVDDTAADRHLLVTLLSAQGHTGLEADQVSTALAQLHAHQPALVILDMALPGRTGLELVAHLQADPTLAATPVLWETAGYDVAPAAQAIRASGDAVLAKPVALADVVRQVETVLRAAGP